MFSFRIVHSLGIVIFLVGGLTNSAAHAVTLQNATATFSQTLGQNNGYYYDVGRTIDNIIDDKTGWAIGTADSHSGSNNQTAVWETATDVDATGLSFKLFFQSEPNAQSILGSFRLSTTSDDRNGFANSAFTSGDVTATWTTLTNATVTSTSAGQNFAVNNDGSIVAGGIIPSIANYTVSFVGNFLGITGIRLEALTSSQLASTFGHDGPGLFPRNGNFVLSEIKLDATNNISSVPLPAGLPLFGTGLAVLGFISWRRKRKGSAT